MYLSCHECFSLFCKSSPERRMALLLMTFQINQQPDSCRVKCFPYLIYSRWSLAPSQTKHIMFSPRIYVSSPIKLCSFTSKVLEYPQDGIWLVTESYRACNDEEISLKKGQHVEVLVKTHGSSRWRVRVVNNDGTVPAEGWVPYTSLRKVDDRENRRKRNSDISHSSSEGKKLSILILLVALL